MEIIPKHKNLLHQGLWQGTAQRCDGNILSLASPRTVDKAECEKHQTGFILLNFRLLQCRYLQMSCPPGALAGWVSLDIRSLF